MFRPYIVGLGGTTREGSSTEKAISLASNYQGQSDLGGTGQADGIILGTPGYHGGLSGLVKNALDYTEDLRSDKRPYLEDRSVGCVVTAAGEQSAVTTLAALRCVVHACGVGQRSWALQSSPQIGCSILRAIASLRESKPN